MDPRFSEVGLDLGYLTTRPRTRRAAFHDPGQVDPAAIETDEATKDVFSSFELPELAAPLQLLQSDCSSRQAVLAQERSHYSGAPCLEAVVMPGAGHDINLHPTAPALQDQVLGWVDAVVGGSCPTGL